MCVKHGLEWGSSSFTMLGVDFSVDLSKLEKINYDRKLKEIDNIIKKWAFQVLSPIGKITVLKSLVISKLNHLFLTIPSPNETTLRKLNDKLYSFIWDDKPDKVKREVLTQTHNRGGLKMLNIENYIKGLKLTWIRRMTINNTKLVKLLSFSEKINFAQIC